MTGDPISDGTIVGAAKALAEPARLAIERLADGCAKLHQPMHVRRMASAEADAALIKAAGEEDVAALKQAADRREHYRKIRQELNLNLIADRASHLFGETKLPPDASPPPDEWVDEFTDQSKDASTDELRELWARLFVAETIESGTVPRRILRTVRDLDASLARSFTTLLACCVMADDGRVNLLVFEGWANGVDLSWRKVQELVDVGLVQGIPELNSMIDSGTYRFNEGRFLRLTFDSDNKYLHGKVISLTSAGIAIAAVTDRGVNEKYVSNLCAAAEKVGAKVEYPLFEKHE